MNTQNRWRSYVLWAAIISQVAVIIGLVGGWQYIGLTDTLFKAVATAVLELFSIVGIVNNPTDKTNW